MIHSYAGIEPLEQRIAPATLVNARTITYTDGDGDMVTVKFSFDVFSGDTAAKTAKANEVFKFDNGTVGADSAGQILQLIDFTKFPTIANKGSKANGVGMTITSTLAGTGDGFADVGAIKAVGISLGKISLDGDIGQIDAGGPALKIGIASLTVKSIGARGISTQIPVPTPTAENPAPDLISTITGEVTKLTVLSDVKDARIRIVDGKNGSGQTTSAAKIGTLFVGGSIIGRTAVEAASDDTGIIDCEREITSAQIGNIIGGGGSNSGRLRAGGLIKTLTISDDISGGGGARSGTVSVGGSMTSINVGDDILGGAGDSSGSIQILGNIKTFTIGGDVTAGTGPDSATMRAYGVIFKLTVNGSILGTTPTSGQNSAGISASGLPSVLIKGSITGGAGNGSAFIASGHDIGNFTLKGSINGGAGAGSGGILAQGVVKNLIISGDIIGGAGQQSGILRSGLDPLQVGTLTSLIVKGKVEGGNGNSSGSILSGGDITTARLGTALSISADALKGGGGAYSGTVSAHGNIATLSLNGGLTGGEGDFSGGVFTTERTDSRHGEIPGNITTLTIAGNFTGGLGESSAIIRTDGGIKTLTTASVKGGTGDNSATITTGSGLYRRGNIGSIRIAASLAIADTAPGAHTATFTIGGSLGALTIGSGINGATIHIGDDLGALNVTGDIIASTITARGKATPTATTDIAIGKISISGNVNTTKFLAGYNTSGTATNPDAQIGSVTVRGNWTASDLVAGVIVGGNIGFGSALDTKAPGTDNAAIRSRIASILITGTATGAVGESHAFTAQLISKARIAGTTLPLDTTPANQSLEITPAGSALFLREIAL